MTWKICLPSQYCIDEIRWWSGQHEFDRIDTTITLYFTNQDNPLIHVILILLFLIVLKHSRWNTKRFRKRFIKQKAVHNAVQKVNYENRSRYAIFLYFEGYQYGFANCFQRSLTCNDWETIKPVEWNQKHHIQSDSSNTNCKKKDFRSSPIISDFFLFEFFLVKINNVCCLAGPSI